MITKRSKSRLGTCALFGLLTLLPSGAFAQEAPPSPSELTALKQQLADQQKQIEQLRLMLEDQKKMLERTQAAASPAAPPAPSPETFSLPQAAKLGEVASAAPIVPPDPLSPSNLRPQNDGASDNVSPLYFKIGTARFSPLGFIDVTSVFRTTNTGSGIGTGFGGIPYGSGPNANTTENRFSLQNSRMGLRVDSNVLGGAVTGYLETDFLGNAPGNLLVTSNSNTLRLRLFWFDWRKDKFEFLGGQTWSLLTPNRKGVSPMPSDVFYSLDMDTNYQAGLVWTRAPEFRFVYHANDHVAAAIALENPEQYVGGAVTFPSTLPSNVGGQFSTGGSNANGPNLTPDVIGKLAFDADAGGKNEHIEIGGIYRNFQSYNALTGKKSLAAGGGGEINGNFELAKGFNLIANTFAGSGVGRYIFGLAPDVVIKPNGDISTVNTASAIGGFEWSKKPHDNPRNLETMFYGYYGGLYIQNDFYADPKNKYEGYGFPGSANSANRDIQEATIGVIQTFWKNPTYGDLKLITQYSYLTRNPWSIAIGAPSNAATHMVFVDLRYDLP